MQHSLFFAIWPDAVLRARLSDAADQALSHREPSDGRRTDPSHYHLTLAYLGRHAQVSPQIIEQLEQAAARIRVPACTLILDRVGCFGTDVGWLGASSCPAALSALHDTLCAYVAESGYPMPASAASFVPHVTMLRGGRSPLKDAALMSPLAWHIDAFALVQGTLASSARYRVLRTFPLSAST